MRFLFYNMIIDKLFLFQIMSQEIWHSTVNSDTVVDCSEGNTDSKTTDNNLTEDYNMIDSIVSIAKRKKMRKRK